MSSNLCKTIYMDLKSKNEHLRRFIISFANRNANIGFFVKTFFTYKKENQFVRFEFINQTKITELLTISSFRGFPRFPVKNHCFDPWKASDIEKIDSVGLEKTFPVKGLSLPFAIVRFGILKCTFGYIELTNSGLTVVAYVRHNHHLRFKLNENILYAAGYFKDDTNILLMHLTKNGKSEINAQLSGPYIDSSMEKQYVIVSFSKPVMDNIGHYIKMFFDRLHKKAGPKGHFEFLRLEKIREILKVSNLQII
jgi:hypothetical protein